MLELLWVRDSAEAKPGLTRPAHLWDHWAFRGGGACPFGFCFRPTGGPVCLPPFSVWDYRPSHPPEDRSIGVATNSDELSEPGLLYLSSAQRPDTCPTCTRQLLDHAVGLHSLMWVQLGTPRSGRISPEQKTAIDAGLMRWRLGEKYLLELGFDGNQRGKEPIFDLSCRCSFAPDIWTSARAS
jgi:hypothetical protein